MMQTIPNGTQVYCRTGYTGVMVKGTVVGFDKTKGNVYTGVGRYLVEEEVTKHVRLANYEELRLV